MVKMNLRLRPTAAVACAFAFLSVSASTAPAAPQPFAGHLMKGGTSGLSCSPVTDDQNQTIARICKGGPRASGLALNDKRVKSFDGQPIDVDVTLPPDGDDGPWPLVVLIHGYAGNKGWFEAGAPEALTDLFPTEGVNNIDWAKRGYAALTISTRGFGASCGSLIGYTIAHFGEYSLWDYLLGQWACPDGSWLHLADARYEARDVQTLAGLLVNDGIAEPDIGVAGVSYGAGQSLILATLKDRVMQLDGTTTPWTSPDEPGNPDANTPMSIAAAGAIAPWSDLADSLLPNGRTLHEASLDPGLTTSPIGVKKDGWVDLLYIGGLLTGTYAPKASQECEELVLGPSYPDLTCWLERINEGEPYVGDDIDQIAQETHEFHSPMGVASAPGVNGPPAPSYVANGWTDDLFPPIQGLRFNDFVRAQGGESHLMLGDIGHMRAQNKDDILTATGQGIGDWFDHFVKGEGPDPGSGATAYTVTCPESAPSGGPYTAGNFDGLAAGAVSYETATPQVLDSQGGRADLANATDSHALESYGLVFVGIDPAALGLMDGDPCRQTTPWQEPGVATYKLPAATGDGYTLLGLPRVEADVTVDDGGVDSEGELAARLWDLDVKRNVQTLVSRGVYRLTAGQQGKIVFELNGSGWHFASGHKAKLELLGRDDQGNGPGQGSYRPANNESFTVTVNSLNFTLPTVEPSAPEPEQPGTSTTPSDAGAVSSTGEPATEGDSSPPTVKIKSPRKNGTYRLHGGLLTLKGSASDDGTGIDGVRYALALRRGSRCRYVTKSGRTSRSSRSCDRPQYLKATGTTRWKAKIKKRLRRGNYVLLVKARDSAGNWSKARKAAFKLR